MVHMNQEDQQFFKEGGEAVPINIRDIYEEALKEDEELREWNKKRPGYMSGTQLELLRSHSGRFGNAFELLLDEEHEEEIRKVIGKDDWKVLQKISELFLRSEETHEQLRKLIDIVGRIAEHPDFQKHITRGLDEDALQSAT